MAICAVVQLSCLPFGAMPINEDESTWLAFSTRADRVQIAYRVPPDPRFLVRPRAVAIENPTSDLEQAFAAVDYGSDPVLERLPEIQLWFQVRSLPEGALDPSWTLRRFAEYFWMRAYRPDSILSPWYPPFEPVIESELTEEGELGWYHLTFHDIAQPERPVTGEDFIRPLSPSRALALVAVYLDYERMSPDAIARSRALVRKIVGEIRLDPMFGPIKASQSH